MAHAEAQRVAAPRLAAIDLDGTLLHSDGSVSGRTRDALAAAREQGITIVFVSARHPGSLAEVAREAGVGGLAICSNGATVYDLDGKRVVRERALETEVAAKLVRVLRERAPGIHFAVESGAELSLEPGFNAWDWEPPPEMHIADALELIGGPVTRLIVRHETYELEVLDALVREVAGESASVLRPGEWTVELSAVGVNKAAALAELCDELGIEAHDVIAFGDFLNDLPMLAWAGHAVAVANAHPDLIAEADEVTASNDEDGVAVVLERLAAAFADAEPHERAADSDTDLERYAR
jgi:Cof subfamily protein (haloacid dehalogenase superfamily)